jgi:glycosyltransferase involved in cell wall biosynthesis
VESVALKILFLTQTYPRSLHDTSGPFIRDLARSLVRLGDEVTVLTPHASDVPARWDDGGVDVRSFRYAPARFELFGYSRSLSSDERMRPAAAVVAPAYLAAASLAVRRSLREGFDLVHAHWIVPNGLIMGGFARKLPVAIGIHGSDVFMAERKEISVWVRRALARTAVVTSCSPELAQRVVAVGFPEERVFVIPYGVNTDEFAPAPERRGIWRNRLNIPASAPVLLSVGRMVSKKGYGYLLDALPGLLEVHPDLHVVLAGGGDLLDEFQQRTHAWSGRVHLPGRVTRDVLPDLYRSADVFVLPAVHDRKGNVDGLPNVILEAMASGLPVVASEISGIPLAVEDGVNGLLVPEKAPVELQASISNVLSDATARMRMGSAARERAVRDLTWDAVAARYREAYEYALTGDRPDQAF